MFIADRSGVELSLPVLTNVHVCHSWDSNTQPFACPLNALTYYETDVQNSGRIRTRFSRNVGIEKRLNNYWRFMRFFECNSILDWRKIVKILSKCIWFLQYMILNTAIGSISTDNWQILLCFLRILLCLGLVSTNLKCVIDEFFKNEFTASIKKTERWPKDTIRVIFLFYFWVENMSSPNIWDCPVL